MTSDLNRIGPIELTPTASLTSPSRHHPGSRSVDPFDESSVKKAETATFRHTPSKPALDPPNSIFDTIAQLKERIEPAFGRYLNRCAEGIEKQFNDLNEMYIEQTRQMEEALQASKNVSFWSIFDDIANTLSSALAFFFGASAVSAGSAVVGGALIASGVLSVGNLAFKHGQIWDWTADQIAGDNERLKQQISTYLPIAVSLAGAALALYGGYGALKHSTHSATQTTQSLLQNSAKITESLTKYKSGLANADQSWKLADLNALQSNTEISKLALDGFIQAVQEFHERQTDIYKTVGGILSDWAGSIQIVQQPV